MDKRLWNSLRIPLPSTPRAKFWLEKLKLPYIFIILSIFKFFGRNFVREAKGSGILEEFNSHLSLNFTNSVPRNDYYLFRFNSRLNNQDRQYGSQPIHSRRFSTVANNSRFSTIDKRSGPKFSSPQRNPRLNTLQNQFSRHII